MAGGREAVSRGPCGTGRRRCPAQQSVASSRLLQGSSYLNRIHVGSGFDALVRFVSNALDLRFRGLGDFGGHVAGLLAKGVMDLTRATCREMSKEGVVVEEPATVFSISMPWNWAFCTSLSVRIARIWTPVDSYSRVLHLHTTTWKTGMTVGITQAVERSAPRFVCRSHQYEEP